MNHIQTAIKVLCVAALAAACAPKGPQAIPTDKSVEAKVEKVLKGMTLEDLFQR